MTAVIRKHTGGVDNGTNRNTSEHITRRLAEHLDRTRAGGDQDKVITHRRARPVIALIRINMLPRNSTSQDINTRQMTVIVRTRSKVDINGANIEVIAINRQLRIRLGNLAHRVSDPNRCERVSRQGLDRTAVKRNDNQTVRINRARGVTDRFLKIRLGKDLARLGVNL